MFAKKKKKKKKRELHAVLYLTSCISIPPNPCSFILTLHFQSQYFTADISQTIINISLLLFILSYDIYKKTWTPVLYLTSCISIPPNPCSVILTLHFQSQYFTADISQTIINISLLLFILIYNIYCRWETKNKMHVCQKKKKNELHAVLYLTSCISIPPKPCSVILTLHFQSQYFTADISQTIINISLLLFILSYDIYKKTWTPVLYLTSCISTPDQSYSLCTSSRNLCVTEGLFL